MVSANELKPRSFNRHISAVSAMYHWASKPTRSAVTGVPRNLMPPRGSLHAPKVAKADDGQGLGTATRDFVMVKGSYLIGCRVTELCRLRWQDIEPLEDGAQIHLLGKGSKARTVPTSKETLALFESLGRGEAEEWLFPSDRRDGPLTRQAVAGRMAKWGQEAGVRLHPHRCRHTHATHAIRRGCDVFTLQCTLGHSSASTTGGYVAANPADSSSLRLS